MIEDSRKPRPIAPTSQGAKLTRQKKWKVGRAIKETTRSKVFSAIALARGHVLDGLAMMLAAAMPAIGLSDIRMP